MDKLGCEFIAGKIGDMVEDGIKNCLSGKEEASEQENKGEDSKDLMSNMVSLVKGGASSDGDKGGMLDDVMGLVKGGDGECESKDDGGGLSSFLGNMLKK